MNLADFITCLLCYSALRPNCHSYIRFRILNFRLSEKESSQGAQNLLFILVSLNLKSKMSVAVGTALCERPPARTVREGFPHTALTSGSSDGQSLVWIRMQNARGREPVANQPCHVLPTPAAKLLTAPPQNAKPDAAHFVAEPAQAKTVTRYRMIVEPPPNH